MRSVVNTKIQPSGKIEKWGLGSRNRRLQTLLRRPAALPSPSPSLLLEQVRLRRLPLAVSTRSQMSGHLMEEFFDQI